MYKTSLGPLESYYLVLVITIYTLKVMLYGLGHRVSLVILNAYCTVSSPCLKPWHLKVSFVSVRSEPPLPPNSLLVLLLLHYGHKPGASQGKRDRIQWVSKCQILLHSPSALNRKNLITTFRKSWVWMGYALESDQPKCILKAIVPYRLQISLLEPLPQEDPCLRPLVKRLVIINSLALTDATKGEFSQCMDGGRHSVDPWNLEFILLWKQRGWQELELSLIPSSHAYCTKLASQALSYHPKTGHEKRNPFS